MAIYKKLGFYMQLKQVKWSVKELFFLAVFAIISFLVPFWGVKVVWTDDLGIISGITLFFLISTIVFPIVLWAIKKSRMRRIFSILNFVIILFMLFLCSEGFINLLVERLGTSVDATVTQVYMTTGKSGNYHVQYKFESDNHLYERTQEVSAVKYQIIHANQPISIKYLRLLPGISALRDDYLAQTQITVFIGLSTFLEILLFSIVRKNETTNPILAEAN